MTVENKLPAKKEKDISLAHNFSAVEQALAMGDLSQLTSDQRVLYYNKTCESLGLNPLTRPFEYMDLDGKLVLYAKKDCTDQLRSIKQISLKITETKAIQGIYIVTAEASTPDGRIDTSTGAVATSKEDGEWKLNPKSNKRYFVGNGNQRPFTGDTLANIFMKAETKAKRRVTLSICGLGMPDESEMETIPNAKEANFTVVDAEPAPAKRLIAKIVPSAPSEESAAKISQEQVDELKAAIGDDLVLENKIIAHLNRHKPDPSILLIEEMPASEFSRMMRSIEKAKPKPEVISEAAE